MTTKTVCIVDTGRGPQLSTSRITVQDFLPYYLEGSSNAEIHRWLPTLSGEEIGALTDYIHDHLDEVLTTEARIKAYQSAQRAAQPQWTRANDGLSLDERRARLEKKLALRRPQKAIAVT
jgi:uncharacterized protein (DUF433 family)